MGWDELVIKIFESQDYLMGKEINCLAVKLDSGINVILGGGDVSHIGAVSMVEEDGKINTFAFPGHREAVISDKWSKAIHEKTTETVVVSAGIHYDNISKNDIKTVLDYTDNLLKKLLVKIDDVTNLNK